jgi:hypothetical protein
MADYQCSLIVATALVKPGIFSIRLTSEYHGICSKSLKQNSPSSNTLWLLRELTAPPMLEEAPPVI